MAATSEHPTRQAIKLALSARCGPMSTGDLAELTDSSLATTSHHLQILERRDEVRRVAEEPQDSFESSA